MSKVKRDIEEDLRTAKELVRDGKFEIANTAFHVHDTKRELERTCTVTVFDHEKAAGMIIQWSEVGTGFGEITIRGDKETGQWTVDTEAMSPRWCARMFRVIEERMRQ